MEATSYHKAEQGVVYLYETVDTGSQIAMVKQYVGPEQKIHLAVSNPSPRVGEQVEVICTWQRFNCSIANYEDDTLTNDPITILVDGSPVNLQPTNGQAKFCLQWDLAGEHNVEVQGDLSSLQRIEVR